MTFSILIFSIFVVSCGQIKPTAEVEAVNQRGSYPSAESLTDKVSDTNDPAVHNDDLHVIPTETPLPQKAGLKKGAPEPVVDPLPPATSAAVVSEVNETLNELEAGTEQSESSAETAVNEVPASTPPSPQTKTEETQPAPAPQIADVTPTAGSGPATVVEPEMDADVDHDEKETLAQMPEKNSKKDQEKKDKKGKGPTKEEPIPIEEKLSSPISSHAVVFQLNATGEDGKKIFAVKKGSSGTSEWVSPFGLFFHLDRQYLVFETKDVFSPFEGFGAFVEGRIFQYYGHKTTIMRINLSGDKGNKKAKGIIELAIKNGHPILQAKVTNPKAKNPVYVKLKGSQWIPPNESFSLTMSIQRNELRLTLNEELVGKVELKADTVKWDKMELIVGASNHKGKNRFEGFLKQVELSDVGL